MLLFSSFLEIHSDSEGRIFEKSLGIGPSTLRRFSRQQCSYTEISSYRPQVHVRPTGSCRRGHLPAPVPQAVAALFGGVSHIHGPFRFLSALSFGVPSASYQPFR